MYRPRSGDDGIYYGWYVTVACFLGTFVVYGLSYSFGVFFDVLLSDFGRTRGGTSLVFSIHTFVLYVGAFAIGGAIDAYGTRRSLVGGGVLIGVGLYWTSRAGSLVELTLAYGVLVAAGLSVVFVVSYATVPRWFDRRRGLAGGLASAGLGVGMVVVAPAAAISIDLVGWRATYLLLSAIVLLALALAIVLIRDGPPSAGVGAIERGADAPRREPGTDPARFRDAVAVARDRSFVLVFVGWIGVYTTLFVVLVHLPAFVVGAGAPRQIGAAALGVVGASSAIARVVIGPLADRTGRARAFVVCSALMGVATLALVGARSTSSVVLFAVVFGAAYGGNGALLGPLVADLFGTTNINTTFGLVSVSFAVSGLLSPWLAGLGYDALGTYVPAFLVSGVAAIVGAGLVGLASRSSAGSSRAGRP